MIEVTHLSKSFKNNKILDDVSFSIQSGQCIGLLGPNGAGKTTLIKCMTGIYSYEQGDVLYEGRPIVERKKDIGYLSQHTDFKPWMSCVESLNFFGRLSGLTDSELKVRVPDVLQEVGLGDKGHLKVEQLSGGMKQRLGIAQAILHRPEFLILDEPVSALDPIGRNEIKRLIMSLKEQTTILLSTHILDDASAFCDTFLILKNGKLIGNISAHDEQIHLNQVLCKIESKRMDMDALKDYMVKEISSQQFVLSKDTEIELTDVIKKFEQMGVRVISIEYMQRNLEDIFLDMVSET